MSGADVFTILSQNPELFMPFLPESTKAAIKQLEKAGATPQRITQAVQNGTLDTLVLETLATKEASQAAWPVLKSILEARGFQASIVSEIGKKVETGELTAGTAYKCLDKIPRDGSMTVASVNSLLRTCTGHELNTVATNPGIETALALFVEAQKPEGLTAEAFKNTLLVKKPADPVSPTLSAYSFTSSDGAPSVTSDTSDTSDNEPLMPQSPSQSSSNMSSSEASDNDDDGFLDAAKTLAEQPGNSAPTSPQHAGNTWEQEEKDYLLGFANQKIP